MLKLIKHQLNTDLENYNNQKEVSLLSKCLPLINTSSKISREIVKKISQYIGYTAEEYRKTLSKLRKGRVLEVYLSNKDYTFNYNKQPSQALFKYYNAFIRNDKKRYLNYISQSVKKKNLNTSTILPYQIVSKRKRYP